MIKYKLTFENDQKAVSLTEKKVIKDTKIMLDYFFKNLKLVDQSALADLDTSKMTFGFDLYICDNETIQEINRDYRKKNKPTDVITFALFADCIESRIVIDNQINLGQIIISAEKTIEQAKENSKEIMEEFYFLLSHGILHLLGFDHKDEDSLEFMLDIQQKMIESVQICQNTKQQDSLTA